VQEPRYTIIKWQHQTWPLKHRTDLTEGLSITNRKRQQFIFQSQ
jgi:hypothetical protein